MISTAVLRIGLIFSLCFVIIRAPPPNSITDETIDFTVNDKSDTLLKYRYVLIAFFRIVDSKKTESAELKGYGFCSPNEEKIIKENKFSGLVQIARNILKRYEKVLSKEPEYATMAYNYRLLEWLKFSMRERGEKNEKLEDDIVNVEKSLEKKSPRTFSPLTYVQDKRFLKTVSFKYEIEERCKEIKNLAQLKEFGTEQDQAVGFLRLLGFEGEDAVEHEWVKMPFPNNLAVYQKILADVHLYSPHEFDTFFRKDILTILGYLYQAIGVRLHFSEIYENSRPRLEDIRLPDTVTDKVKYTCEVMKLFNYAIEQVFQNINETQLSNKYDLDSVFNRKKNRRIENFYLDLQQLNKLQNDAVSEETKHARSYIRTYDYQILQNLILEVVSKYDEFVEKMDKQLPSTPSRISVANSRLPDAIVVYYSRVMDWLNAQMKKVNTTAYKHSNLSKLLANILRSNRGGGHLKNPRTCTVSLPDSLDYEDLPEDEYLKLTTMDELYMFFVNGRKRVQKWRSNRK